MRCNLQRPISLGVAALLALAACGSSSSEDDQTVSPDAVATPDECARVADGTRCDDGDPCTTGDACEGGACVSSGRLDCSDGGACEAGRCEAGVGCVLDPLPDGEACEAACFEAGTCQAGRCDGAAGAEVVCPASSDPCVAELACDPATGACEASSAAAAGTACDVDDDPCTLDACDGAGACQATGAQETCAAESAANPCYTYACMAKLGCVKVNFVAGASCDDGDGCTISDVCVEGEDGERGCVGEPFTIDDSNPCTDDACVAGVVSHDALDGVVCDDVDNLCLGAGLCEQGVCDFAIIVSCDDGDPCTVDACEAETGTCAYENAPAGTACDDGNACTTADACDAGLCLGATVPDCCGNGQCEAGEGCGCGDCDGESCDPGAACVADATCQGGQCVGVAAFDCCGNGVCELGEGCDCADCAGQPCSDDDACTSGDTCQGGQCAGAVVPDCCGNGVCEVGEGCACGDCDGEVCDDAEACTTGDVCAGGACVGATVPNCCGNGACEAGEGCECADCDGESCDDGEACTRDDLCQSGVCSGAAVPSCCGNGACELGEGCDCADCEGEVCGDAGACVSDATCQAGACAGTTVADCCGNGACEAGEGCACADCEGEVCEDGDPCTGPDACAAGVCAAGPVDACCAGGGGTSVVPCGPASRFVTASGYDNNAARLVVLDAADGAEIAAFSSGVTVQGFDGLVTSTDGRWAASWGTGDGYSTSYGFYGFYDLSTTPPTKTGGITSGNVIQAIQEVVMMPGDRALGVSKNTSPDGGMVFVDLTDGSVITRVARATPNYGWDRAKMSPDGRYLVAWSAGWPTQSALGYLRVYDVSDHTPVQVLHYDDSDDWPSSSVVRIQDAALTACGEQLVVISEDISVIDVATGQRLLYAGPTDWLKGMAQMAFTDDGERLFVREWTSSQSAFAGYHVVSFSGATPVRTHTMNDSEDEFLYPADIATIPGTHLGASAADMAAIWDLDTGERIWGGGADMSGLVRVTDDGARVLFVGHTDYTTNVAVMNTEGASPTSIGSGTSFRYIGAAEVIPGTHRALLMGRSLYVLDLDTFSVESSWALPNGSHPFVGAAISCDGTRALAWTGTDEYSGYRDFLNLANVPATRIRRDSSDTLDSCQYIAGGAAAP